MVKNRNPLFVRDTHIGFEHLCVDEMHTMHLGIFSLFVRIALWRLVDLDPWQARRERTGISGDQAVANHVRQLLYEWYKAAGAVPGGPPVYEYSGFNIRNLGSREGGGYLVGPKAAETGSMLRFVVDLLRQHRGDLGPGGAELLGCGEALVRYLNITRDASARLSAPELQGLMDTILRFLSLREAAGIPWLPKHAFGCAFGEAICEIREPTLCGDLVRRRAQHEIARYRWCGTSQGILETSFGSI